VRKISASNPVSDGFDSSSVKHRSIRSRPSWLSIRNSLVKSSIPHPRSPEDQPNRTPAKPEIGQLRRIPAFRAFIGVFGFNLNIEREQTLPFG